MELGGSLLCLQEPTTEGVQSLSISWFPNGLFPCDFMTRILYLFLISPTSPTEAIRVLLICHSNNNWRRVHIMKLLIKQCCPSHYFLFLSSKCSPRLLVLKHLHICSFVHLELIVFLFSMSRC